LFGIVGTGLLWLLALRLIAVPDGAAGAVPWPVLGAAVTDLIGQPLPGPASGPALGCVLALCGALCWIATGTTRRRRSGGAPDPVGRLCGIAAPLCFVLHLCLEPRLPLDAASLLAAAALGLGPLGIAHLLWVRGTCRGDVPAFSAARQRGAAGR
jgi:drug/metabolite transporter (DMT)-like permease